MLFVTPGAQSSRGGAPHQSTVRDDYQTIRGQIRVRGIDSLTGDLGKLVQARTKGPGYGSTSRAFYARPIFVAHILDLQKLAAMPRVYTETI